MSFWKQLVLVCGPILLVAAIIFAIVDPVAVGFVKRVRPENPDCREGALRLYLAQARPLFDRWCTEINVDERLKLSQDFQEIEHRPPCADAAYKSAMVAINAWGNFASNYEKPHGLSTPPVITDQGRLSGGGWIDTQKRAKELRPGVYESREIAEIEFRKLEEYLDAQ